MTEEAGADDNSAVDVQAWVPGDHVRAVTETEDRYSRGFLRCKPEKWLPNLGMQWLPLLMSLESEVKFSHTEMCADVPGDLVRGYVGSVDDEPVGILVDNHSAELLTNFVVPGVRGIAQSLVLEYLSRRLFATVGMAWSGPESKVFRFEPDMNVANIRHVAAIRLVLQVNGEEISIWFKVGKTLAELLDGLWRRQLRSTTQQSLGALDVHFEVAHIAVPPSMLSEYLKPGTIVDVEKGVSDDLLLVANEKPWRNAKVVQVDGCLGAEIRSKADDAPLPDGHLRVSFEYGSVMFNEAVVIEMDQNGAIFNTGAPLGDKVNIVVNKEIVGQGRIGVYQGRFVVSVL